MKKTLILTLLTFLFSQVVFAKTFKTETEALSTIDATMKQISDGKFFDSFIGLVDYTVNPAIHTKETINKLVDGRKKYDIKFGNSLGYELIKTQRIGKDVAKYLYLEKTQNHLLKWTFIVYNTSNGWKLLTYKWDDEITELFE